MRSSLFLLLMIFILVNPSFGNNQDSGNKFLKDCKKAIRAADGSSNADYNAGYCTGFINGFVQANQAVRAMKGESSGLFCPPDDITTGQLVRIVTKYLETNPGILDTDKNVLTYRALNSAFPCKGGR